jgi:alpha-1,3/alpha-1,6-mannosyltransferase
MFYCHFPDKLLCTERGGILKKLYRLLIDNFEESSTGCANEIVVNSLFTASIFAENFTYLGQACQPQVLYPTIELPEIVATATAQQAITYTEGYDYVFASLNRYERKKNIALAIRAFHLLLQEIKTKGSRKGGKKAPRVLLVVAGGYDERVAENVEHYDELVAITKESSDSVSENVVFRRSISDAERNALLTCATAILYTPANEHFGIVPLEAMSRETPVIAVCSGGPLETVVHEETGFLCEETPLSFMTAMHQFIEDEELSTRLGRRGREHSQEKFSFEAMVPQLEACLQSAVMRGGGATENKTSCTQLREEKFLTQLIVFFGIVFVLVVAVILGVTMSI